MFNQLRPLSIALLLSFVGVLIAPVSSRAQDQLPPFEIERYRFVAGADDATALFLNPAGLAQGRGFNTYLDGSIGENGFDGMSLGLQFGNIGLGYAHQDLDLPQGDRNLDHYLLGAGFGPRTFRLGIQGTWTTTDLPGSNAGSLWFGLQSRPHRRVSLGLGVQNANHPSFVLGHLATRYTYGVGIRPLRNVEELTLDIEGSSLDGAFDDIDLSLGVRWASFLGWDFAAVARFPYGEDFQLGASATAHFEFANTAGRVRSSEGRDAARGNVALQLHESYWRNPIVPVTRVATTSLGGRYTDEGSGFVLLGSSSKSAMELIRRLDDAALDPDIRALAVRVGGLSGGFLGPVRAQHEEIRQALLRFRASGKPVVAYLEAVNNGAAALFVASAADRIIMPHMAGVQGIGVSFHLTRYKGTFEKLGIAWDADTAGTYKSTFHGFYTDSTSAPQRVAIEELVNQAYVDLVNTLMASRGIDEARMADLATGRIVFPDECVAVGLVDSLGWWEDALRVADRLSGGPGTLPPTISLPSRTYWNERWAPPPAVAVVPVSGSIRGGRSGQDWVRGGRTLGAETVVRQLRAAASHPQVRAIVFRVDTGGGSALASERIRGEIRRLKQKHGIPFYVSMGSAAASGGYWIAMDADTIFADRSTITGSIGVVSAFPVFAGLYDKLDMTSETFKRGEHSDMFSFNRHMTPDEREMVDASLGFIYEEFVHGVAEGRGLPPDRVRQLAEGRVYFGSQAVRNGLVDQIGTLHDAVTLAAERTGIRDEYDVLLFRTKDRGLLGRAMDAVSLPLGIGSDNPDVEAPIRPSDAW